MRKRERSRVIHLSDAQIRIPRRKGEHAIRVLQRGSLDAVETGDVLFVAAGIEHQLVDVTEDFAVWRLFYGPQGGEIAAAAGA